MNNQNQIKGISTPVGILIILIAILLVGGIVIWQLPRLTKEEVKTPPIETPTEPIDKIIDCGTNFDCFIEASKMCKKARVTATATVDTMIGMLITHTSFREIRGIEGNKCVVYERLEKENIRFTDEYIKELLKRGWTGTPITLEEIKQKEEELNKLVEKVEGKDGICKFKNSEALTAFLNSEKQGVLEWGFSIGEEARGWYGDAECEGELFVGK